MPSQQFFELEQLHCRDKFSKILASESHFERFGIHTAGQRASHSCDSLKQLRFLDRLGHGLMVSFNTSQLFTTIRMVAGCRSN